MRIPFSYADVAALDVPEQNLLACLEPRSCETAGAVEQLVNAALDQPVNSPPIEQLASPASRVLLLVDDATRQTPASLLLPALLRRLESAGVARPRINILIAAGTHSRMSPKEVEQKLGAAVASRYAVTLHYWKSEETLARIGHTADGTPIRVNRMLQQADLVIGVGQIVPHRVMGYTGGATIVQPGVSGPEITGYTHWRSALFSGDKILGVAENPVRLEVEEIARRAGLRFIVNVVLDARHRVTQVVAGDPVAAHRQGAGYARQIWGVAQPAAADIVVAESFPADYDLWQAAKGIYASELSVRPGGVVILVTPCLHGVSGEHPEVERIGYHGFDDVRRRVERKEITDLVAAAHLVHVGRVICDKARGIMVSPGIPRSTQQQIGFTPAESPQQALSLALERVGARAQVVVLRQGGNVLPVVERVEARAPDSRGAESSDRSG